MKRAIQVLGVVTTIGMFAVLVMGAAVTNTGSQRGCGRSWPLCHGKLIPQFAVQTLIEWSHRFVVGVETALVLGLAAGALYLYRDRLEIVILTPIMVVSLFVQAGLGAWAVMYPQAAVILALHFGVSLIAFASVFLTAMLLFEIDGARGFDALRLRSVPPVFVRYVWGLTIFTYIVVYSGAFVRHISAQLACTAWPLCNGALVPALTGKVAANIGHRLLALALTLAVVVLFVWARRLRDDRRDIYLAAHAAMALVVLQALVGAIMVWSRMDLLAMLAHAGVVGLLFATLTYLGIHVLPLPARRPAAVPRPAATPVGATPPGR